MRMPFRNFVHEQSSTIGTGTLGLQQVPGSPRFSDVFADGDPVYYSIRNATRWEEGYGTYLAPNQLARTTVRQVFNGTVVVTDGQPLSLTGVSIVRSVVPAEYSAAQWRVEQVLVGVNTLMEEGHSYGVVAVGLQLTLPNTAIPGDRIEIYQAVPGIVPSTPGPGGPIVFANGHKINSTIGDMTVDVDNFYFTMVYVDPVFTGWRVLS